MTIAPELNWVLPLIHLDVLTPNYWIPMKMVFRTLTTNAQTHQSTNTETSMVVAQVKGMSMVMVSPT